MMGRMGLMGLVAVMLGGLVGCSLFDATTPKSDVQLTRSAVDGSGKLGVGDSFRLPNQWAAENVSVSVEEDYQPSGLQSVMTGREFRWERSTSGTLVLALSEKYEAMTSKEELLRGRRLQIDRNTDPTVAGQVAVMRAESSKVVAKAGIEAAATVGASALTGSAISFLGALSDGEPGQAGAAVKAVEAVEVIGAGSGDDGEEGEGDDGEEGDGEGEGSTYAEGSGGQVRAEDGETSATEVRRR